MEAGSSTSTGRRRPPPPVRQTVKGDTDSGVSVKDRANGSKGNKCQHGKAGRTRSTFRDRWVLDGERDVDNTHTDEETRTLVHVHLNTTAAGKERGIPWQRVAPWLRRGAASPIVAAILHA